MIIQILTILDSGILREPLPTLIILLDQAIIDILKIIMLLDHFYRIMIGTDWEDLDLLPQLLTRIQEALPPYPCKYCTQNCITNAYHWHYDCPFKNQNPTPLTTSTTTDKQITPESQSEQNSSHDANNSYWQLLVPGHFNQNGSKLKADSQYVVKNASSGEIIP